MSYRFSRSKLTSCYREGINICQKNNKKDITCTKAKHIIMLIYDDSGKLVFNQTLLKTKIPMRSCIWRNPQVTTYVYRWPKYFTDKLDQFCNFNWWVGNLDEPVEYIKQRRKCFLNNMMDWYPLIIRLEPI